VGKLWAGLDGGKSGRHGNHRKSFCPGCMSQGMVRHRTMQGVVCDDASEGER
jgi:hypothetical protein